jgi:hypothetical protein
MKSFKITALLLVVLMVGLFLVAGCGGGHSACR